MSFNEALWRDLHPSAFECRDCPGPDSQDPCDDCRVEAEGEVSDDA